MTKPLIWGKLLNHQLREMFEVEFERKFVASDIKFKFKCKCEFELEFEFNSLTIKFREATKPLIWERFEH